MDLNMFFFDFLFLLEEFFLFFFFSDSFLFFLKFSSFLLIFSSFFLIEFGPILMFFLLFEFFSFLFFFFIFLSQLLKFLWGDNDWNWLNFERCDLDLLFDDEFLWGGFLLLSEWWWLWFMDCWLEREWSLLLFLLNVILLGNLNMYLCVLLDGDL